MNIPINRIDGEELEEAAPEPFDMLLKSIERHGLMQPIYVVPTGDRYLCVAGRRRLAAVKLLQWQEVNANIIEGRIP